MKIAIDISPLKIGHFLQHRVRGTGFYLDNLKKSLLEYYPQNQYIFFTRGENVPKDVDLVHYPYFEPFFLTLPIFNRHKTVVTVHDLTPLVFPGNFPGGFKGNLRWQIQKSGLKKANAIITDSRSSKSDLVDYAGIDKDKINVIYLASGKEFKRIDDIKKKAELRKKYELPDKFVLYVGDVTWNKNLPGLLLAAKKDRIPLVMVGKALINTNYDKTNPWNKDLDMVRILADADRNIIRLGFVPTEDLVTLYNIASVFVMPSLYEGFGLPLLEAMACGCPVVTSKNGSIPEVVGDAAFFVDANDVNSIAHGITKIFTDTSLQKDLSAKGFKRAQKFSWQKTAEETVGVYQKILNK